MDIARLLHRDDSDESDHEPFVGVVYSPATPPASSAPSAANSERAVARRRPQRPRKPTIADLRAQVEVFEGVVKYLPYVLRELDDATATPSTANSTESDEDDPTKSRDPDAERMYSFLKRTVLLTKEAQEELAKRTEYLCMLKRHYESTANLRKLMRGVRLDDWFWMCERWRSITHDYYEPLSEDRCYKVVQETLLAIKNHKLPESTKGTDAFGWRDWFNLDDDGHYVRFMTRKTLQHIDILQLVDHSWSIYADGDLFKEHHLGDNCELFHQVVQQISPDMMVVQCVEKYPTLAQLTHALSLIFRVQTETGYMIVCRSIESPRLLGLMKADGLSLCGSFLWDTFDVEHRDAQGECDAIRFTLAGSLGSDDPTYAKRWCNEILIALVRSENKLLDSSILPVESTAEEISRDATSDATSDAQTAHVSA